MKKGKLDLKDLSNVIKKYKGVKRENTILGSAIGEDCSILNLKSFSDEFMLISSDPITFTSKNIGKLGVIINTNDVYATGGEGYGLILNIFLPESATLMDFEIIMNQIHEECLVHNLEILGGHTEVTDVVNDIMISVTIIGTCSKNYFKTSSSNVGDSILLTKTLGIEGTTILFDEFKHKLSKILNEDDLNEVERYRNFISIRNESLILKNFEVTSMHDVTEGGLIGALLEISLCSQNGFRIFKNNIGIGDLTRKICNYLGVDVLRLISSGNLIFTCKKSLSEIIKFELTKNGIDCFIIGEIIERGKYFLNDGIKDNEIGLYNGDSFFNC